LLASWGFETLWRRFFLAIAGNGWTGLRGPPLRVFLSWPEPIQNLSDRSVAGLQVPTTPPLLAFDIAQLEPFGKQIWDWCSRDLSAVMRQCLNERLADPNYQKETRKQIWAEIGVDIGLADKHRMRA